MKNVNAKFVLFLLLAASAIELYGEYYQLHEVIFFTKPLLLPLLALYYIGSTDYKQSKVHTLMALAFLFSWFGDISLMLTPETPADTEIMGIPKSKYFFLAGLGSFLVTQILFIRVYKKSVTNARSHISKFSWVPFVIYWLAMLALVLPPLKANEEKSAGVIPVIIYASILISMAYIALLRFGRTTRKSFWLVFTGACVFVVSDSLIAINFLAMAHPLHFAGVMIMSTYILAEFLIAKGVIEHYNKQ